MMRLIFNYLVAPLLVFFVAMPSAFSALNDFDRQEFAHDNALAKSNPGFESGVTKWTASGGTFVSNSGTQIIPNSKQYATWDSNAASQTLLTEAVTVAKTGNCEFAIWIAVPSGTATHTITVNDGTNDLVTPVTITNNTNALRHIVNFPCPASGTVRGKLTSVASNEPSISLDNGRLGIATNVGTAGIRTEPVSYTPTGSWVTNTTYTGKWWRVDDRYFYRFRLALAGAPTATSLTVNHLISGVSIDTTKILGTNTNGGVVVAQCGLVSAGTGYTASAYYNGNNVAVVVRATTGSYASVANVNATVPATFTNNDYIECEGSTPIQGWAAGTFVMPDAQGWFAAGFISGANPALGGVAVSSYAEIANGSLSLTQNTGSASVGIACSSTNASTVGSSTCSVGNEIIGVTTVLPRSGVYEACFQFGHVINIGGAAGGSLTAAFQVVETANSSGTITTEGNGRITSGAGYEGGSNSPNQVNPVMVCGTFNLSAGQRLFKVYYEQAIPSGTIFTNEIQADASASVGQRNIYFTIKPVTSQQQTVLANSVISRDAVNGQVTTVNTVVTPSTTYTATANEETIRAGMSGGAWTLSLPAAAGVRGKRYYIVLPDDTANGLTIDPNGAETICGQATVVMRGLRDSMEIQSDGTNWIGLGESCWRTNSARIDCDSGSTVPVDRQRLISTIGNISGGTCSLTLNTGNYSGSPGIVVSWNGTGASSDFYGVCSSATSCAVGGGGAVTTAQLEIIVRGPR